MISWVVKYGINEIYKYNERARKRNGMQMTRGGVGKDVDEAHAENFTNGTSANK